MVDRDTAGESGVVGGPPAEEGGGGGHGGGEDMVPPALVCGMCLVMTCQEYSGVRGRCRRSTAYRNYLY